MRYPELPLSDDEMRDKLAHSGGSTITVEVPVELDEMIGSSVEDFADFLSNKITGSDTGLEDIAYTLAGVENDAVLLEVTGRPAELPDESDVEG